MNPGHNQSPPGHSPLGGPSYVQQPIQQQQPQQQQPIQQQQMQYQQQPQQEQFQPQPIQQPIQQQPIQQQQQQQQQPIQQQPQIQQQHSQQQFANISTSHRAPLLSESNPALSPSGVDMPTGVDVQFRIFEQRFQKYLDTLMPYRTERWAGTIVSLFLFMIRILVSQGWYIVCYTLGIYLLNLFLLFITPMFDPALEEESTGEEDGLSLPMRSGDEFRPFVRRLPEFKFWISATRAVLIGLFATMFSAFDIPVFWPVLLVYFFVLFGITMRRQIAHMIKYKYVPWTSGKKRYTGRR